MKKPKQFSPQNLIIKRINLLKLKDKKVWAQLLKLTFPSGAARRIFEDIKNNELRLPRLVVLYLAKAKNNRYLGWAAIVKGYEFCDVWCYTRKSARRKGLQKILLKKIKQKGLAAQKEDKAQIETFKYYDFKGGKR